MPQVVIEREDSDTSRARAYASTTRKVIPAYPGETVPIGLNVYGPREHVVEIIVSGLSGVASISVTSSRAEAPYKASILIKVNPSAQPGLYSFTVKTWDETDGLLLGVEKAALLVLKRDVPKTIAKCYSDVKGMFREYGSAGLLWYILRYIYPKGATFRELKTIYELVVNREVSDGTISNILSRLIRKGIISREREDRGIVYKVLVEDFSIVRSRIDTSRIRTWSQLSRERLTEEDKEVPYAVYLAYWRALKIADKHGVLPALLFLAHTLCGVRQTGYLLLWRDDMFITCEAKTGFCHVFHSPLISQYFEELGIQPGVMVFQVPLYQEAWRTARRYIRKYYKSFAVARRLHYLLKEAEFIWYDEDEILNLEIHFYDDGSIGVVVKDNKGEETLWEENIKHEQPVRTERRTAFPYEHVYHANEETYFHRPGRIL